MNSRYQAEADERKRWRQDGGSGEADYSAKDAYLHRIWSLVWLAPPPRRRRRARCTLLTATSSFTSSFNRRVSDAGGKLNPRFDCIFFFGKEVRVVLTG